MHNQNSLYFRILDKSSLYVKRYLAGKFDIDGNYYKVNSNIVDTPFFADEFEQLIFFLFLDLIFLIY